MSEMSRNPHYHKELTTKPNSEMAKIHQLIELIYGTTDMRTNLDLIIKLNEKIGDSEDQSLSMENLKSFAKFMLETISLAATPSISRRKK